MRKEDLRIVFLGTPDFAVESLKALVENIYNIVGVVTMPDKIAGRGHKIQQSPVKQYALSKNLPIFQPESLKDEQFINDLKELRADLQIVVAFRMLPEIVWNMPPKGTFNLHASLLPQYRGAAPINWSIINGEKETGVTTFFLKHDIDTGNIIFQEKTPISDSDNAGTLHDRLMQIGSQLVLKTTDAIINDNIIATSQQSADILKSAPKIYKETCRIDWSRNAIDVRNFIRGLSPYPAAWTELHIQDLEPITIKIFDCEIIKETHTLDLGSLLHDKSHMDVAVADGIIRLLDIQQSGKKRMSAKDFLNGFAMPEKAILK
ncbi:MAG: methionyl-tRNA formyltransferase [Dysgonamonadaceae bacterium]